MCLAAFPFSYLPPAAMPPSYLSVNVPGGPSSELFIAECAWRPLLQAIYRSMCLAAPSSKPFVAECAWRPLLPGIYR